MIAGGIDVGGTKIEASVFDAGWHVVETRRIDTPTSYPALIAAVQQQADWMPGLPLGIGLPGRHNPENGLAFTANLPASKKPLRRDIQAAISRPASFGNDCDLFTLSEAQLGAGRGFATMFGLVLGTGIGGGFCLNGSLVKTRGGAMGEVGHLPIPATLGLPLLPCGCGRKGCFETLASGPGMVALGKHMSGKTRTPADIAAEDGAVFAAWVQIVAALISSLQCTLDPECIVLGGGLSNIGGLAERLSAALPSVLLKDSPPPHIYKAEFGASSGTRGAALLAIQEAAA